MTIQRTLSIIKPDATKRNLTDAINKLITDKGLTIIASKEMTLDAAKAGGFYEVHKDRPFYGELVEFMTSGSVVVQVLEGEDAVVKYREVMGDTDPANAAPGTIRAEYAEDIGANSVHGSDSAENAANEIKFFFEESELAA